MNKQEIEKGIKELEIQIKATSCEVSIETCEIAISALEQQLTIQTQQKDHCYSNNDCEYEVIGDCTLQGPCPHQTKQLTVGDKIRESNENLAEHLTDTAINNGFDGNKDELYKCHLFYLNQPIQSPTDAT